MSKSHTATLTEAISTQPHGIVLVWCYYSNETVYDGNSVYCFVPKHHIERVNGGGVYCTEPYGGGGMYKYVFVYDTKIVGYDNNTVNSTTNGITNTNMNWVLHYVIGV